jgi:hypothetical protein
VARTVYIVTRSLNGTEWNMTSSVNLARNPVLLTDVDNGPMVLVDVFTAETGEAANERKEALLDEWSKGRPPAAEVGNWPRYYLARLQEDFAAELERRRAGPGGQRVGVSEYAGVPMSLLKRLERECRHMLQREGSPDEEMAKYGEQPPALYTAAEPTLTAEAEVCEALTEWQATAERRGGWAVMYARQVLDRADQQCTVAALDALATAQLRSAEAVRREALEEACAVVREWCDDVSAEHISVAIRALAQSSAKEGDDRDD